MGMRSGTAGAGDVLCRWMWREDLFVSEVHPMPSLGPFSLQVFAAHAMAHAGEEPVLGGCI